MYGVSIYINKCMRSPRMCGLYQQMYVWYTYICVCVIYINKCMCGTGNLSFKVRYLFSYNFTTSIFPREKYGLYILGKNKDKNMDFSEIIRFMLEIIIISLWNVYSQ